MVATPSYPFIDRRGMPRNVASNRLIQSAVQTSDRKAIPQLDYDMRQNVSGLGRKVMMSIGRHLFWNYPVVSGAIKEQANFAVSTFIPQYWGRNKEWGTLAEEWLLQWHKIMDVRGAPFDYDSFLKHQITHPIIDGDVGILLVGPRNPDQPGYDPALDGDKYPQIQLIPGHRIGSPNGRDGVVVAMPDEEAEGYDGSIPYNGMPIIDGVVLSNRGRALAYALLDDDRKRVTAYVSSRDMILNWNPQCCDQLRGLSELASCLFDLQDLKESRNFELLAQKTAASITLIEKNSTGFADEAKGLLASSATLTEGTGVKTAVQQEKMDGGQYRYFRASSGEGLEAFSYDRPGANAIAFQESMLRDAFRGMGWDHYFSTEILKVGGAPLRVLVDKINLQIKERQKAVAKVCMRVGGYALSKAMKLGLLPWDDDWWKFEYQGPARLTADHKYEIEGEIEEHNAGFTTLKDHCNRRGTYWEDVQDQKIAEAKRLKEKSEEAGIEEDRVQLVKGKKDPQEVDAAEKKQEANKERDR